MKRAQQHLRTSDTVMAALIERFGACTMFDDQALLHKPSFHVLVWAILNQQLSVASAASIEQRLLALHRGKYFTLSTLENLSDKQLAGCGLSRQKIRYLRALCAAVRSGQLRPGNLWRLDNDKIAEILTTLPGIGPWSIDMFLMFSLARLDVLPLGDLALRRAIFKHYSVDPLKDIKRLQHITARWSPYRSIASWYLWCSVD